MNRVILPGLLLLIGLAVGCGEDGPKMYSVSGTVTLDGQPLPEGDIVFASEQGDLGADAGKIENGQYSVRVKPGNKRVKITAHREVEGKTTIGAMGEEIKPREQYIPARYNEQSELTTEVTGSQDNLDFALHGN